MSRNNPRQLGASRGLLTPQMIKQGLLAMHPMDQAALATAPVPIVGDIVGGAADLRMLFNEPSWGNAGWAAAGLLPFVPAGTVSRKAAQIAELPMDEALRLQRAEEMGFTQDIYHGSKQDITEFVPGYKDDGLIFASPDPEFANNWIGKGKYRARQGAEAEYEAARAEDKANRAASFDDELLSSMDRGPEFNKVYDEMYANYRNMTKVPADDIHKANYPLKTNVKNTFVPHENVDIIKEFFEKTGRPEKDLKLYTSGNYLFYETPEMVDFLKSKGFDSMKLKESSYGSAGYTTLAVFDPKNIRSRFAKFDPNKINSRDILATTAPVAVGAGLLSQQQSNDD